MRLYSTLLVGSLVGLLGMQAAPATKNKQKARVASVKPAAAKQASKSTADRSATRGRAAVASNARTSAELEPIAPKSGADALEQKAFAVYAAMPAELQGLLEQQWKEAGIDKTNKKARAQFILALPDQLMMQTILMSATTLVEPRLSYLFYRELIPQLQVPRGNEKLVAARETIRKVRDMVQEIDEALKPSVAACDELLQRFTAQIGAESAMPSLTGLIDSINMDEQIAPLVRAFSAPVAMPRHEKDELVLTKEQAIAITTQQKPLELLMNVTQGFEQMLLQIVATKQMIETFYGNVLPHAPAMLDTLNELEKIMTQARREITVPAKGLYTFMQPVLQAMQAEQEALEKQQK